MLQVVFANIPFMNPGFVLPQGHVAFVRNLKRAYDVIVVRLKAAQDTSKRWFGLNSVESSVFGEFSSQHGGQISNVVEVEELEYLPHSVPAPQVLSTRYSEKIPSKRKSKRSATPSHVVPRRRFEFDDESVVLPKG